MAFSVGEAISKSFNRTMLMMFKPFDIKKWFVLGFCAWLAYLGERGFHFNFSGGWPHEEHGGGGGGPDFSGVGPWMAAHLALLVLAASALFCLFVVVVVVVGWLKARGQFMFLDGVARNRGAVVEPWQRFSQLGNSLFWFNLVFGLAGMFGFILIMGLGLMLAWADLQAGHFGVGAVLAIVAVVLLSLPWLFVMVVIHALLHDFVVPIMYVRNVRTLDGWRIFGHEVVPGHVVEFVVFYLVKWGLGILVLVIGAITTCLACCCCCLTLLPYISTVIVLPLLVFMRCYSLYYLEQAGPQWRIFAEEPTSTAVLPPTYEPFPPAPPPVAEPPPAVAS